MHQDEGHYAGKHPQDMLPDKEIAEVLKPHIREGRISCSAAHKAAAEAEANPSETGRVLDLLEVRITGCQLGLFGHGGKDHGKAGLKLPLNEAEISAAIDKASAGDGLSCLELWSIADEFGCTKIEARAVCEKTGIKIKNCQLGAF